MKCAEMLEFNAYDGRVAHRKRWGTNWIRMTL